MAADFRVWLKIPRDVAAPLLSGARADAVDERDRWARYGVAVHRLLSSDEFESELAAAVLWDSHAPNLAARLRAFLGGRRWER